MLTGHSFSPPLQELNTLRSQCGRLYGYDWISIPLVYTQVSRDPPHLLLRCLPVGTAPCYKGHPHLHPSLAHTWTTLTQDTLGLLIPTYTRRLSPIRGSVAHTQPSLISLTQTQPPLQKHPLPRGN